MPLETKLANQLAEADLGWDDETWIIVAAGIFAWRAVDRTDIKMRGDCRERERGHDHGAFIHLLPEFHALL